jgi:hypothetical protein
MQSSAVRHHEPHTAFIHFSPSISPLVCPQSSLSLFVLFPSQIMAPIAEFVNTVEKSDRVLPLAAGSLTHPLI